MTSVGGELKALYTNRLGEQKTTLARVKAELEAAGDDAAARTLVIKAPEYIETSKKLRQKWGKIVKTASD